MTNGDGHDPSDGTAIPDDQAPVPAGASEASLDHPFADNQFDFGEFIDRLRLAGRRFKDSSLLQVFIGIVILYMIWAFFYGGLNSVVALAPGPLEFILGFIGFLLGCITWAITPLLVIVLAGLQVTFYRPMSKLLFDRSTELPGPVELAKEGLSDFFKAVVTILPMIVTLCCPPLSWAAAFFLGQAPYLVVVRDYAIGDAFRESFERSKRHWHVLVMAILLMIAVAGVAALLATPLLVLGFVGGMIHAAVGALLWPLPYLAVFVATIIGGFIISTTAFASIDELEGLATIDPDLE